jgi:hypothetical protein
MMGVSCICLVFVGSVEVWDRERAPVYAWCSSAQLRCGIVSALADERNEI